MPWEPISPELALVDPELGARARAALPTRPWPAPRATPSPARTPVAPASPPSAEETAPRRSYPAWARLTAALWLVVIGILIGGAAIPHAQDRPRVVPPAEEVCPPPQQTPAPTSP